MNEEDSPIIECHNCGQEQKLDYKFCNKCGTQNLNRYKENIKKEKRYNENLKFLARYTFIIFALLVISSFTGEGLYPFIIWTICFAIVDLIFGIIQPEVWKLFSLKNIQIRPLLVMIGIGVTSGILVFLSIEKLNLMLGMESYNYNEVFEGLEYSLVFAIILTAVFPAFFEEMAFRGFVYNNLSKLAGQKSAIWGSSFLFGLVHFSLLSLYWIIPFGLILAYFRTRYNTIIYGIVGHFIHNTTVVLLEHYEVF